VGKPKKTAPQDVPRDEQGAPWPPPLALAAHLDNYGNNSTNVLNGALVEVGAYLPEHFMFEVLLTERVQTFSIHETIYVLKDELAPVNQYTKDYLSNAVAAKAVVYPEEAYDLRDRLDAVDIHVKVESVAAWTAEQRGRIDRYLNAVNSGGRLLPAKPEELP
jgi:hypothetical protein